MRIQASSAAALFCFFAAVVVASSGSAATNRCETLFQKFTFQTTRVVETNRFVTSRGLREYRLDLTDRFTTSLDGLKTDETWIDFGAGKAIAAEDYLLAKRSDEAAHVLAITYKYGRWFPKYRGPKLQIQKNMYFEELTTLRSYHLGSDLYGVFSYTKHLDHYFDLALSRLHPGRQHFIFGHFHRTIIVRKSGERQSVAAWLKDVSGQNVELVRGTLLIVTRTDEAVRIPRLRLIRMDDQLPPGRVFEEY